jgi:hypothetical protein
MTNRIELTELERKKLSEAAGTCPDRITVYLGGPSLETAPTDGTPFIGHTLTLRK